MSAQPTSIYAVIESGVVTNLVVWDGGDDWTPPSGSQTVLVSESTYVTIGSTYAGGVFTVPAS